MPNWTASMQQTFEYYVVDPGTWKDKSKLSNVKSCTITRDSGVETLGSATFEVTEYIGECYIRVYLVTIQNGIKEKHSLGTFLVQTPSMSFDGKLKTYSLDAYTPLLELKEKKPPIGYSILKDSNILEESYLITRENVRAPVIEPSASKNLDNDFVADTEESWISFNNDLLANAEYKYGLDELSRILFLPDQDTASLQPVWTYTDNNSSILLPEFSLNHDLYGIPNVVEVIYSSGTTCIRVKVVNDDYNSPISTVNRGREIPRRVINPSFSGVPTEEQLELYATQLLRELSTIEYTVSYTHGYCPVRLGDCVRLNYSRADVIDTKAKVTYQSIKCTSRCQVSEKAVYTKKLWG